MDYYSSGKVVREKCFIFGRGNLESATILAQSPPKNDHFFLDMQTRQFHPYMPLVILDMREPKLNYLNYLMGNSSHLFVSRYEEDF